MKKFVALLIVFSLTVLLFASNSSIAAYISPYSLEISKGTMSTDTAASIYGFGAKVAYYHTFDGSKIQFGVGGDFDLNDFFYINKTQKSHLNFDFFAKGGLDFISTDKTIIGTDLGFGVNINMCNKKTEANFALMHDVRGILFFYNNISLAADLEIAYVPGKNEQFISLNAYAGLDFAF